MPGTSLRLGDVAPDFQAESTTGPISFHAFLGTSWGILFSHPADYTPVCTTELGTVAKLAKEFAARDVKFLGVSVDSVKDHLGWIKDINETQKCTVTFPILDDKSRTISKLYGMLDQDVHDATNMSKVDGLPLTVRSVFVIDPAKKVRLVITYPATCGRNFAEILRVVDSLQLTDKKSVTTPADWTPGGKVIIHPKVSNEEADKMFPGYEKVLPYLRLTTL